MTATLEPDARMPVRGPAARAIEAGLLADA